ncbi:nuclear transport factor 2 family protein [Luteimonas sp. SX5]|uniref:Nuclear transport factor 2 family protein n=1 Tax=Luteimonas galliterrae TaxID=2940486 RepID=A0ABT0MHB9_9GAMM|nr:nuclear transport factor 2 family protein [Luteimonas galliterrae]MCL1634274.1 nuclear transport factor 2 family protein [Luteimonas galliterrae]
MSAYPQSSQSQPNFPAPSRHSEVKLQRLNAEYVEAFLKSDADWYERHLAEDFRCILSDGTMIDRARFLADTAQPAAMKRFDVEDVTVQFEGDTAIVQARAVYEKADGTHGQSLHTDIWVGRDGRWQALLAHATTVAGA